MATKSLAMAEPTTAAGSSRSLYQRIKGSAVLGVWITATAFVGVWLMALPVCLFLWPVVGVIMAGLFVMLMIIPLGDEVPQFGQMLVKAATAEAVEHFSLRIIMDDGETLKPGETYLFGHVPHSAFPVVFPLVFSDLSVVNVKGLGPVNTVGSTACFVAPLVRHLWHWLGARPATRESISSLLKSGRSCAVCPGGVREIQYMEAGSEVAFLTQRRGFVKLAIQNGASLVPVFAFGQTAAYRFWRIGPPLVPKSLVEYIGRAIGFQPLLLLGAWGTTVPRRTPITVVIGKPIRVPHETSPKPETVQEYLDKFINQLKDLFERHKIDAGYPKTQLRII